MMQKPKHCSHLVFLDVLRKQMCAICVVHHRVGDEKDSGIH